MENTQLALSPAAEAQDRHHHGEGSGFSAAPQTTNDQLLLLMEEHARRLDELLSVVRQLAEKPQRSREPRAGRVFCPRCGTTCASGDGACPECCETLRTLSGLASAELGFELEPPGQRFDARGWKLVGNTPVECPGCVDTLYCAIKLYEANGAMQKYWALLCSNCNTMTKLDSLRREHKDVLNGWARSQKLMPQSKVEPSKALSPTLSATWEAIRSGLRPEQVAADRGLALTTIYGHLSLLIQLGQCKLEQLISPEVIDLIVEAHGRYPRPVDLPDLESRLPLPLLRQDVLLVSQALGLEMGLGDFVDEESRARIWQTFKAAVGTYPERLTSKDLLGMCLGTDGYRTGSLANRAYFGSLRGFAQAALAEELRRMAREGALGVTPQKRLIPGDHG